MDEAGAKLIAQGIDRQACAVLRPAVCRGRFHFQQLRIGERYFFIDRDYTGGLAELLVVSRDTCTGVVSLALRNGNGFVEFLELSSLRTLMRATAPDLD